MHLSVAAPTRSSLLTVDGVSLALYQHVGIVVALTLGRPRPAGDSIRPVWPLPLLPLTSVAASPAPGVQRGLWRCQLPLASLPLLVAGGEI